MTTRKFSVGNKVIPDIYYNSSLTLEAWPRRAGKYVSVRINNIRQLPRNDGKMRLFYETRLGTFRSEELSVAR